MIATWIDPLGRSVTLYRGTWFDPICTEHAAMWDNEHLVQDTIEHPDAIYADVEDPSRECSYRTVPSSDPRMLIKTCVEFEPPDEFGEVAGFVVTVSHAAGETGRTANMAIEFELSGIPGILASLADDPQWDAAALVRAYDEASDTFTMHFFGRGIPTFSAPVHAGDADPLMLLVESSTERVVGIHVEHFLRSFVPAHPPAAKWLADPEWRTPPRRTGRRPDRSSAHEAMDRVVDDLAGELVDAAN